MKKTKIGMKLDRFKKISGKAIPKARSLALPVKIGIMYRSPRLIWGSLVGGYCAIIITRDFLVKSPADIGTWLDAGWDSGMLGAAGLGILLALFLIQSGVRRMLKTIWIIEHGETAIAARKRVSERIVFSWFSRRFHPSKKFFASCSFVDASGKNVKVEVIVPQKDSLHAGDPVRVVYDPGIPSNAVAVDALPRFVRTSAGLDS